jgi:hypothetical protein
VAIYLVVMSSYLADFRAEYPKDPAFSSPANRPGLSAAEKIVVQKLGM